MAGEAGDVLLAVGELGINLARHDDHHARYLLLMLFVAGEVPAHMAGIALHTEPDTKRTHRIH